MRNGLMNWMANLGYYGEDDGRRKGVYSLVWHIYRHCLDKSSAGLGFTIFAWLAYRLDLVMMVLKRMNVVDAVLLELVSHDRETPCLYSS